MGGALWVLPGASGEYKYKAVSRWSNSDVVSWLEGLGQWTQSNLTHIFIKEVQCHACSFMREEVPMSGATYIVIISSLYDGFGRHSDPKWIMLLVLFE